MKHKTKFLEETCLSLLGGGIYGACLNLIIIPFGLYSGTFTGVAQMIHALLTELMGLPVPEGFNLTGLLYFLLNVPLLLVTYRELNRQFLIKSAVTVVFQMLVMTIVPIPGEPLLDNILTATIIGGIIAGIGSGIALRAGGSGGGVDILGIYCAKKYPGFSVGKISMIIGAVVFTYCLIRYDMNIVVYSAIFTVVYAAALDKAHYQNIKTSAMIFTKKKDVQGCIVDGLGRGATYWKGYGGFSEEPSYIFMTVISKYEVVRLRRIVHWADPDAFIIFNDQLNVSGNFEQRL